MDYDSYSDPEAAATAAALFFAIFAVIMVFYLVIFVGIYVLTAFALMSFFRKVGVKRWIAWVPFYSTWVWLQVGGQQGWFALLSLIPGGSIVSAVFLYIGMYRTGIAFRKAPIFLVLGICLPWVWLFMLGSRNETYEPALITAAGYSPPLAGFGSVPNAANTGEPGSPLPDAGPAA